MDAVTLQRLREAAERLGKPQSAIVREAIQDFHDRIGNLSERERLHLLRSFDRLVPKIPQKPAAEVERELRTIRDAWRTGGRRTSAYKHR